MRALVSSVSIITTIKNTVKITNRTRYTGNYRFEANAVAVIPKFNTPPAMIGARYSVLNHISTLPSQKLGPILPTVLIFVIFEIFDWEKFAHGSFYN